MSRRTRVSFTRTRNIILGVLVDQFVLLPIIAIYYKFLRKRGKFHLIVCNHIGDFLVTMGYIDAFMKEKQIDDLVIVSDKKFQRIFDKYVKKSGISFRSVDSKCLKWFERCNIHRMGRAIYRYWGDLIVVAPGNEFMMDYDSVVTLAAKYGFTFRECLAFSNLQLKENANFRPMRFKCNVKKNRNILFCIESRTIKLDNDVFFDLLREKLENIGYSVDVNEEEKKLSLMEFIVRCSEYQMVIGTRSGIMDIVACSSVSSIVIYPKMRKDYMCFYDVNRVNATDNCKQYMLSGNQEDDAEKVLELCESLKFNV